MSIAGIYAHAVGAYPARFAGRGDDLPAGAHAEGVYSAAIGQLGVQLIFRRAQIGAACRRAVLRAVDQALRMLDAHAHREGLLRHRHACVVEHAEGVARAVANSQDQLLAGQFLLLPALDIADGAQRAVLRFNAR